MIGYSLAFAVVFAAGGAFAGSGDLLGNIGDVRLKGYLGKRLDAMIANHVAGQDVDYITAPFMEKTERRRSWQTEFWGKWMHSAVPYARYLERGASAAGSTGLKERIGLGDCIFSLWRCIYRLLLLLRLCSFNRFIQTLDRL